MTTSTASPCPCCATVEVLQPSPAYTLCRCCGHRWRLPIAGLADYETLVARNDLTLPWSRRKMHERVVAVSNLLQAGGERVLEVGCAEGELGRQIKARHVLTYDGVELSQDRAMAARHLDQVFHTPAIQVHASPYDLIVSFHVLEHVERPDQEIQAWASLLSPHGRVVVEVPNQSGHPLLASDRNPEHLHQFTCASLSLLFTRNGFACQSLSTGHYESPVYADSLRLLAHLQPTVQACESRLIERIQQCTGGPFLVYGIGGDYLNYIAPLAQALPIRGLLDSSASKWGQRFGDHVVAGYDPSAHGDLPIVICSIRFAADIHQHLLSLGIATHRIIGLDSIFENT